MCGDFVLIKLSCVRRHEFISIKMYNYDITYNCYLLCITGMYTSTITGIGI